MDVDLNAVVGKLLNTNAMLTYQVAQLEVALEKLQESNVDDNNGQ